MKNKNIMTIVVVAIIVGAVAFYGGMQYQKMQRNQLFVTAGEAGVQRSFGGPNGGRFGGGRGFTPVMGEITDADDKSVTVKMMDGSSKIVVLSDKTSINKSSTGTKSDLKSGVKVAVFGTTNSDGSVTAQSIQLNPQMRVFQARPSAMPSK